MFCPNCGSPINDGAQFCPICGSKMAVEQEIPAAPETDALTPEANMWSQPEPVYEAPAYTAPAEEPAYENPFAQPSFEEPAETPKKPKKPIWKVLIPAVAIVAVLAVAAIFLMDPIVGFFVKTFGSDQDYFIYVEEKAAKNGINLVTGAYGTYVDMFSKEQAMEGSVQLTLGDEAQDMLSEQLGDFDLDWINDVVLRVAANYKSNKYSTDVALDIGSQNILDAAVFMDLKSKVLLMGLENLNDEYLEADLEEVEGFYEICELLEDGKLVNALPSEKTLNKLMNKYYGIILANIKDIDVSTDTVEAGDLSQKVTVQEIKLDQEDMNKIAQAVLKEVKKDEDLKKIICDVAKVLEKADLIDDADDVYDEFKESVSDALDELKEVDFDDDHEDEYYYSETEYVLMNYIDSNHNIIGRKIESKTTYHWNGEKDSYTNEISYITVTKGNDFATEIDLNGVQIYGEGTRKGNKVNAEFTMEAEDTEMLTLEVSDLTVTLTSISGKVVLKPTDEFWSMTDLDASIFATMDPALSLDFSMSEKSAEATIAFIADGETLVGVTVDSTTKKATEVSLPSKSDRVDIDDADEWVENIDFEALIEALDKTSVPDELIDSLEMLLAYM